METLVIIDHDSHTLFVEEVSEEVLEGYCGDEQAYIDDHYALENYSWDYIVATVYTAPDGSITEGADITKLHKKTCAVCGREITSGYVFDGKTWLCSDECAAKFFDDDEGCVEILLDEGKRLEWRD